jgi:bifunctional non-homologous end joining protein LigD
MPARYIVFDVLSLGGADVRPQPLEERQRILKDVFANSAASALADSFGDGKALFAFIRQNDMEGIVSKRMESRYTPGKRHSDWFKTKTLKKLLCVITGIYMKNSLPASLALGVYREGEIADVGAVSSGLKQEDWLQLMKYANDMIISRGRDIIWIEPNLTCWVRFSEWTQHGTLRNPVLLGFSDKRPHEAAGEETSA